MRKIANAVKRERYSLERSQNIKSIAIANGMQANGLKMKRRILVIIEMFNRYDA